MEPLRGVVACRDAGEAQVEVGVAVDAQPGLEDVGRIGESGGAEGRLPEAAQALRVQGVDAEELEVHPATLWTPRLKREGRSGRVAPHSHSSSRKSAQAPIVQYPCATHGILRITKT